MKRFLALLVCCLLAGCALFPQRHPAVLHYDGIYQSGVVQDADGPYWFYLRFYPDGTVIDVSSTGEPADLRAWFKRGMDDPSTGHVAVHGDHLAFSQTSRDGTVDYQGTIVGDTLHMTSYSHINGYHDSETYTFVRWLPAASASNGTRP